MSLSGETWSIGERRRLARLLAVYPLDAYKNIAANMRKKSADEVEHYLKKMITSTKRQKLMNKDNTPGQHEPSKAPLETWLDVAGSLVKNEQYDFSKCLSEVMAFISHFEEFPRGEIEGHPQPDYKVIYKYLSQLLENDRHEDIEELGALVKTSAADKSKRSTCTNELRFFDKIENIVGNEENAECCVVVDLLHSLMELFSECDLSVQFNVLRWKYFLLNERDPAGHPIPELLRQASENDFGDFLRGVETSSCGEKESGSSAEEGQSVPEGQGPSTQGPSTENAQEKSCQAESKDDGVPQKVVARYTYEANYSTSNVRKKSDPRNHLNDLVYHNQPGRKTAGKCSTTVTEIVRVVPPKNAKIVQIQPRAKKPTIRDDGKYFGINCGGNVKKVMEHSRPIFHDVSEPVVLTDDKQECLEAAQARKRKYKTLIKKRGAQKEVKKPKLYSLNPFCLPISLLDIDS